MRVAIYTLGCKVNQYETQAIAAQFQKAGFELAGPEEKADVFVVNSCTVTATGDKKTRNRLARFRRENPDAVVVLSESPRVAERGKNYLWQLTEDAKA